MRSKLPKPLAAFARMVGVARTGTSAAEIEAALVEAQEEIEAATADRAEAERRYTAELLESDEAELAKRLAEKDAATIKLDRARALSDALATRLREARQAEAQAARKAIHDDAVAKCAAIRARLPEEYRVHALALRGLLADLAEAEVARLQAQSEAPEFPAIVPPEDEVRGALDQPEEIVSSETVHLWVMDGRVEPLPEGRQGEVRSNPNDPDRGRLAMPSTQYSFGPALPCTRRAFTRTRFREAVAVPALNRLYQSVNLPALHRLGDAYVGADPTRVAEDALAHLSGDRQADPTVTRAVRERLELVPTDPSQFETSEVVPFRSSPPAKPQGFGGSGYDARPIRGEKRA